MAAPTLKSASLPLRAQEAQVSRLDGKPAPPAAPSTWAAWATRQQALTGRLTAYSPATTPVPTPTPTPPANGFLPAPYGGEEIITQVHYLKPGEKIAKIPVRLAKALPYQVSWLWHTRNGDGPSKAYQGIFFDAAGGWLTFMPGQIEAFIEVPINVPDMRGAHFYIDVSWTQNQNGLAGAVIRIEGGDGTETLPPVPAYKPKAPALKAGRTLKLDENFLGPISTSGETGKWWTRPSWGDVQSGNGEKGVYAAASTHPGIDPHPIVGGKRVLRAGVAQTKSVAGGSTGQVFPMYGSMLQGERVFGFTNGYMELRCAVNADRFCVPAFWMVTGQYGQPSYAEVDIFELGLGGNLDLQETIHSGAGWVEGVRVGHQADGQFHTYGFDVTPEEHVFLIDGVIVHRRPNPFPNLTFPGVILNIGIGGALGPSPDIDANPGWRAEMVLESLRVWE